MRPEADPMGITREGGSAPGPWEALWRCSPHVGSIKRTARQRGWGRALAGSTAGLQHCNGGAGLRMWHPMGPLERITVAEEVEDTCEKRGDAAGGRRLEAGGAAVRAGEGDVTDAGAAAAPVPSEGRAPRQMLP